MEVQKLVGVTPDGAYGPLTKAAVEAWQANNGLVPVDGIFGAMSRAKAYELAGSTGAVASGDLCPNGMTLASNCTVAPGTTTTVTLCPNGMTFASNCTVAPGASTSKPSTVRGGAGDLTVTGSSKNTENSIKEGTEENVLAYKLEAEDSDIEVTNVKVWLQNDGSDGDSSEKVADYIDEVKVYLGSEEVGSADASDFTRESKAWDIFTKSINLKGAVISEGSTDYLYVAVVATDDIDSEDDDAKWNLALNSMRYVDGTGAIMTADTSSVDPAGSASSSVSSVKGEVANFDFKLSSDDDSLKIKSSSANPDNSTVKVDDNSKTKDVLALAFKLEVGDDSSSMDLESLAVKATIKDPSGATMTSIDTVSEAEKIIDSVKLKIAGESFDAEDLELGDIESGIITYYFDIDGDITIDAGDVEEAKVYVTFYDQGTAGANYLNGTSVKFVVDKANLEAEVDGDSVSSTDISGSQSGATLTLSSSAALVSNMKWSVNSTGTIVDFFFTVEADDDDYELLTSSIDDYTDVTSGLALVSVSGDLTTDNEGTLSRYSGDSSAVISSGSNLGKGYFINEGDKVTFRVRYSLDATAVDNGKWVEVTIKSVAGQTVTDDLQTSPTATVNL